VQQQIDNLLRFYRQYIRVYVNDIVIFFKILKEYVDYLYTIFYLLNFKKVILFSKKLFLSYSLVILLRQKIDIFDLIVSINKIATIKNLNFLYKLFDLELYFNLIK